MFVAVGALRGLSLVAVDGAANATFSSPSVHPYWCLGLSRRHSLARPICVARPSSPGSGVDQVEATREDSRPSDDEARQLRRSADWRAARAYKESGVIFNGRIEGFNDLSKSVQDIAKDLVGSSISVKVTEANEEEKKLIFSEKDAAWSKYSGQVKVGDIFDAIVGSMEDYGAFAHLRFPDGCYYLTGLVHVSEVSWDLVQDVRDFLNEGDQVKVKIIHIDREKARITLSIKQLEDDPLFETLDKVITQEGQFTSDTLSVTNSMNIEPLPGLESICKELMQEDGITEVRLGRQGLEKRVVSQDLELWLSNVPAKDRQFTLLARAGRQVQEVYLTTTLDQDGIKKAVQRVLQRVP